MTSSTTLNILNNNSLSTSSLPSPPISHYYPYLLNNLDNKKMPTFTMARAPPSSLQYSVCNQIGKNGRSGMLADSTRYTSCYTNRQHRDIIAARGGELRPFLFNPVSDNNSSTKFYLPPIQHVIMTTPTSSPSPPFDSSYYAASSTSPISSIASSPTPVDEEEDDDDEFDQQQQQQQQHQKQQHQPMINIRRKGSIASLLNSLPELKQLDEEESKCNYLSHFMDNTTPAPSLIHYQQQHHSLKRGRPRQQDHNTESFNHSHQQQHPVIKKQRKSSSSSLLSLDFVQQQQACQSLSSQAIPATTTTTSNVSTTNESPRATKGLRHFSKQVCDKVAEKGVITYNEVADELALDIQNAALTNEKQTYDQKNIRRRVYDALNVLMAMNIIAKDKKVIKWLGIPDCYQQEMSNNNNKDEINLVKEEQVAEALEQNKIDPSRQQLLLKQIEQEELRQTELMNSLNLLRKDVNNKLAKHLQIRNLVCRNQKQIEQQQRKEIYACDKVPLPFFIVACPTNKAQDKHLEIINHGRSAVISVHHENQLNTKMIYEDSEVLRHLQQTTSQES